MAAHSEPLLHHILRLASQPNAETADAALLERFVSCSDEGAFAALLARHGPMVLGVCRRVLRDGHRAEDAFQATFFVLACKAAALRRPEALAAWLYGTARRLALTARRSDVRRCRHETDSLRTLPASAAANPLDELTARELLSALDEEMERLPEAYRLPLILCGLEGRPQEEAARLLGWTPDSVRGRLERGRARLRARLSRRGLALGAGLLAMESLATATVSAALRRATVQKALTFAAGSSKSIAATALALTETGVTSMVMTKAKLGLMLLLVMGLAAGTGVLAYPLRSAKQPEARQTAQSASPKPETVKRERTDRYGDPLPPGAVARLGTVRFRVESEGNMIRELTFAPDGKTIAVASLAGLSLFDAATGKRIKNFHPPYSYFWQVAFSPDGGRLLAAFQVLHPGPQKSGVQIWDIASGRKTTEVELKDMLRLGWTAEGQPLVAYREKEAIILREIATGRKQRFSAKDLSTPFTSNYAVGKKVLTATSNESGVIHVWDMKSGKERWAFETGGAFVSFDSLVLSPDERWIASLTTNIPNKYTVQLWDLTTGKSKPIVTLDQAHLESTAFTRDGKTLATIGQQEVRFWDTASGGERGRLKSEGRRFNVSAVGFAPDGKTFAAMENTCGAILLWDVATGKPKPQPEGHSTNWVQAASFSPDGKRVATSGGMDGTIRVWDAASGRLLVQFHRSYPNYAAACAFSTDGRTLCSSWNDQLLLSDAATGRELQPLKCANTKMYLSSDLRKAIALQSPGGGIGGMGGANGGPPGGMGTKSAWEMIGWDIATRKQFFHRRLTNPVSERNLTLSPDAKVLAVPNVKREPMHLEDVETGARLLTFPILKGQTAPLAFSPDGRLLLSETSSPEPPTTPDGFKRTLCLWEVLTASELAVLPTSINLSAASALSPDSRLLATIAPEGEIFLWDLATGKELCRFKGHDSSVTSLAFSPDSRRLVSGLYNTTLLVWDVPPSEAKAAGKLGVESVAKAWDDLAGNDAKRAFRARWTLVSAPREAISFLQEHLHRAKAADPQRLRRLLVDLDSEQFEVRENAQKELAKLGELAEEGLRQTLVNKPTLETRRRVQTLLDRLRGPVTQPQLLQALRAVAVLEDIDAPEARRLLEKLATGAPEARLTREAKESLRRKG